jgi:hypothetical protein
MCFVRPVQGFDKGEAIDMFGNIREKVADPSAGFAVLFELPGAFEKISCLSELDTGFWDRQGLAVKSR